MLLNVLHVPIFDLPDINCTLSPLHPPWSLVWSPSHVSQRAGGAGWGDDESALLRLASLTEQSKAPGLPRTGKPQNKHLSPTLLLFDSSCYVLCVNFLNYPQSRC